MKKLTKILVSTLLLFCVFFIVACDFNGNSTSESNNDPRTYTVTFLNYDNTLLGKTTNINEGEPAIYEGLTPKRPDTNEYSYYFIGWDKDISAIYSDLAVFAKYEEVKKTDVESNKTELNKIVLSKAKTIVEKKKLQSEADITSFRDDNYYYFVFDLGQYYNIPIDSTYDYCYYGGVGEVTKTMTASSATSSTIQASTSNTHQETTNFSSTKNFDVNITVGYTPPAATGGGYGSVNVEAGYSRTKGDSTLDCWTNTFTEAASYSNSETKTTSITFKNGDPAGNYYYYLSVDTQIYGTIIKDIKTGDFYVTIYSSIIGRGFNYVYCGQDNLKFSCEGEIDFDYTAVIDEFNLNNVTPSNYYGTIEEDEKIHIMNVEGLYTALKKATKEDVLVLDEDIDCTNFPWYPIDNFYGTLIGNGKKIKNLSYSITNTTANNIYYGMFKKLSGSLNNFTIENLTMKVWNFHTNDEYLYVGGICGVLEGSVSNVIIENSYIYGYNDSNEDKKMHSYVGGVCGQMNAGTIKECKIRNSTVHGKSHVDTEKKDTGDCWSYTGGFIGFQNSGVISQCTRYEDTSVKSETVSAGKMSAYHCIVGGIVGYQNSSGIISNCFSTEGKLETIIDHNSAGTANSSERKSGAFAGVQQGKIE